MLHATKCGKKRIRQEWVKKKEKERNEKRREEKGRNERKGKESKGKERRCNEIEIKWKREARTGKRRIVMIGKKQYFCGVSGRERCLHAWGGGDGRAMRAGTSTGLWPT